MEAGGAGLATLRREAGLARDGYEEAAHALSAHSAAAAMRLARAAVAGELAPLKLDAARFRTMVAPLPEAQWGPSGQDRVEFEIATNPGTPFAPLAKIASGGELSRFILALKVALAEEGGAATMIFDEVDRGVGGAVASAIGERLARLARGTQLLVVTHSPQVAARADRQLLIQKRSDGLVARTGVHALARPSGARRSRACYRAPSHRRGPRAGGAAAGVAPLCLRSQAPSTQEHGVPLAPIPRTPDIRSGAMPDAPPLPIRFPGTTSSSSSRWSR